MSDKNLHDIPGPTDSTWVRCDDAAESEGDTHDLAVEILGDLYDCKRVWSAWQYGNMDEEDFELAAEDEDIVADVERLLQQALAAERERSNQLLAAYEQERVDHDEALDRADAADEEARRMQDRVNRLVAAHKEWEGHWKSMKAQRDAIGEERDKWASLTLRERDKPKCVSFDPVANSRWCEREQYVHDVAMTGTGEPMAKPIDIIKELRGEVERLGGVVGELAQGFKDKQRRLASVVDVLERIELGKPHQFGLVREALAAARGEG
jgi:hypothetical protein